MAKTPTNQPIHFTDAFDRRLIKYTTPCKYEDTCHSYNPALKLEVTVGVEVYPETQRTIEKNNPCVMGGGCGCAKWRRLTNQQLGGYDKPGNTEKAQSQRVVASVPCQVESRAVDELGQRLLKLKNMKIGEL